MSAEQHAPNKRQRELLDKHLELVIEENKVTNLTRIVDWESAQVLHVEDSLAGLPEVEEALEGPYLDMGSGAGFPGIPLAIMTGRETLLADPLARRRAPLIRLPPSLVLTTLSQPTMGALRILRCSSLTAFRWSLPARFPPWLHCSSSHRPCWLKADAWYATRPTVNQRNLSMLGKLLANWEWNSFLREDSRFPMERRVEPSSYFGSDAILR